MIEKDLMNRFKALYSGSNKAYGQWSKQNRPRTVRKAPANEQWDAHLTGKIGLGIVPIKNTNLCSWGAIDIDIDDIDHAELARQVQHHRLPLVVCRSKSGGAHCYYFLPEPALARLVRKSLSDWAAKLRYGSSEIFPKQDQLGRDTIGNWINLPYFDAENTIRYGVHPENGKMGLEEFVAYAEHMKSRPPVNETATRTKGKEGLPPCLNHWDTDNKVPVGGRNEALYNFAIYLKKAHADSWEEKLHEVNYTLIEKPLSRKELSDIIKSISRKDYHYKCVAPLLTHCDRLGCEALMYGIQSYVTDYEDLMLGSLTKILTNPPRWAIEINGVDLTLTTEEIMDFRRVRTLCMERIDIIAPPMRNEDWLQLLRERMEGRSTVEAPSDASDTGRLEQGLGDFIQLAERTRDKRDLARGMPVRDKIDGMNVVMFKGGDLVDYIKKKKIAPHINMPNLWLTLREMGYEHKRIRVGQKTMQVWYINNEPDAEPPPIPHDEEVEI